MHFFHNLIHCEVPKKVLIILSYLKAGHKMLIKLTLLHKKKTFHVIKTKMHFMVFIQSDRKSLNLKKKFLKMMKFKKYCLS